MKIIESRTATERRPIAGGRLVRATVAAIGIGAIGFSATILAGSLSAYAQNDTARSRTADTQMGPPMPPARPADLAAPSPAPTPQASQPVTPGVPAGVDPMVADFAADMPQELPPASRTQMQKCGSEWQKMKETGAATDKTWLAFAQSCLAQGQKTK